MPWGLVALLAAAALGLAAYRRAWLGRDTLGRSFMLALLAVLVAGKVFSPQYVLWLLPVAAYVEGLCVRWLLVAALVYTIMYCYNTIPLPELPWSSQFMASLIPRNVVLLGIAAAYACMPGDRIAPRRWPAQPLWRVL